MLRVMIVLSALSLLGATCVPSPLPPVTVEPLATPVEFLKDVKPVLDRRCAVCHSCYNAACQLKLNSYEGISRGGSKAAVYSASRLKPQQPTRLFIDAHSTEGWRNLGFFSVIENRAESPANNATMLYLLEAKKRQPVPSGEYYAEAADLSCPANLNEVSTFLARHPEQGMPFGFPPVSLGENAILETWLSQGAIGPTEAQQQALTTPAPADAAAIEKWESFLNQDDAKHALTARYLYEHFFLAHIRFPESGSGDFFELVRSTTPPGEPISVIATRRPYDDPGGEAFYYRFRKIHATIVYKTHIVTDFGDDTLARFNELFIETEWFGKPRRMEYGTEVGANPFYVYAQIPPIVRYRFLLDHAEYMIRTFIRGPVCKGQVALNVIRDHFWVMFLDPEADQSVIYPDFLLEHAQNLALPDEAGSDEKITQAFSNEYRERYIRFYRAKAKLYDEMVPEGQGLDAIWPGRRASDAPVMTVYRHFDSASVHKGVLGRLPRTLWVIDYPQFERIYYALVAGFDVFGNVAHQLNVRRYMDYLRVEGELNFLQFLPADQRLSTIQSWYIGVGAVEDTDSQELLTRRPTKVEYSTGEPKRELIEKVVRERILKSTKIAFDRINYRADGQPVPMPKSFKTHEDVVNGFRALTAPGTGFIRHMNGYGVNVMYLRVRDYAGEDRFISIVINRWHDNVNSIFFEKRTLDPAKDTIDFLPESIGAYPNYFFELEAEDIPDFFDMLQNFDGSPEYVAKVHRYGVNRADPHFWEAYDWFQARMFEQKPIEGGLYDLSRYYPKAIGQ